MEHGWCIISGVGELMGTPRSGEAHGRWRRRGDLWLLVLACAVGTAVAIAVASFARPERRVARAPGLRGPAPAAQDAGRAAPAFRLRGAHGELVDERALRGRPFVVTFLYTRCTDACPLIGADLRDALSRLGPRADEVTVAAITVDPAHDTPAAARAWLRRLHEPSNVHYLLAVAAGCSRCGTVTASSRRTPATQPTRTRLCCGWLTAAGGCASSTRPGSPSTPPTSRTT